MVAIGSHGRFNVDKLGRIHQYQVAMSSLQLSVSPILNSYFVPTRYIPITRRRPLASLRQHIERPQNRSSTWFGPRRYERADRALSKEQPNNNRWNNPCSYPFQLLAASRVFSSQHPRSPNPLPLGACRIHSRYYHVTTPWR